MKPASVFINLETERAIQTGKNTGLKKLSTFYNLLLTRAESRAIILSLLKNTPDLIIGIYA
jgi:hypothetical protein